MATNHFKKRFADQEWIIFDIKRGYGLYYDLRKVNEVTFDKSVLDAFTTGSLSDDKTSENEVFFKDLWKTYFQHLAIKERFNPKLQKQMMPVRFWKYITEMQ
jgi:probable DNA metabolism protein